MAGASLRPCAVNWIICKHVELPGATRAAKNISLPSIVATCQQLCSPCATHSIKLMGRPARILPVSPALSGSRRLFSDAGRSRHSAAHKKNQWPRSQWSGMGAYTHVKATHKHSVPSGCVTIAPHRCHSRSAISVINFFSWAAPLPIRSIIDWLVLSGSRCVSLTNDVCVSVCL